MAFFGNIETPDAPHSDYDLSDIPPIEKICQNKTYSHEVESCLRKHIDKADDIAEFLSARLKNIWNEYQDEDDESKEKYGTMISEFEENEKISENYVNSICNRKLYSYWSPGSIRISKILSCHYILKRERVILINRIYTILPIIK